VWNLENGQSLFTLEQSQGGVLSLTFSHDRGLIAGCKGDIVHVWNAHNGRLLQQVATAAQRNIWSVVFSPKSRVLFAGSLQGTCYLIDADRGEILGWFQAHGDDMTSIAISSDGRRLATTGDGNATTIWDTATKRALLTMRDHVKHVRCVAFSPDGHTVASAGHDGLVILRTAYTWNE
jgi:WD40 repeat protein